MMFTTQEEARAKWCPFARSYNVVTTGYEKESAAGGINRAGKNKPDNWCLCIASDCMMWRWHMENRATGSCGLARAPT